MRILQNKLIKMSRVLKRPFAGQSSSSGMTLIEIIIVVALLGSLMAVLVKNVMDQAEAKEDQTRIQMGNIAAALDMYRAAINTRQQLRA